MDTGMDSIGDIGMGSGMDTIMECVQVIVQVTVQGGLQHQEMYTGIGPAECDQQGLTETKPIMQEIEPGARIRVLYQIIGRQQVIGPRQETGPQRVTGRLPARSLPETGPVAVPEPSPPLSKTMYMQEETGMYTEEIIMGMFSNEIMVSGVAADQPGPEIAQAVSKM